MVLNPVPSLLQHILIFWMVWRFRLFLVDSWVSLLENTTFLKLSFLTQAFSARFSLSTRSMGRDLSGYMPLGRCSAERQSFSRSRCPRKRCDISVHFVLEPSPYTEFSFIPCKSVDVQSILESVLESCELPRNFYICTFVLMWFCNGDKFDKELFQ